MPTGQMRTVLNHLRKALPPRADSGASDWELLQRFAATRDETAFEALVWRHHQMVLSVCGRILADADDVEDAFQACFLVLARRAGQVQPRGALASWLYGVARRVALEARRSSRRRQPAPLTVPPAVPEPWEELGRQELRAVFDEELGRLPEKYRAPVVLCYLRGMTYDEVGRHLGCPKGTVATRLTRARELLRHRLARRGLALSAGSLAAWLCEGAARAGASRVLVASTIRATAGKAVSANVLALAEGATKSLSVTTFGSATAVLLGTLLLTAATGALALLAESRDTPAAQVDAPGAVAPPAFEPTIVLTGHRDQVWGIACSPDGRLIATAGRDRVVLLWDARTGRARGRFELTPDEKAWRGSLGQVAFSPDGKHLAATRGDGAVVWDLETRKEVQRFESADCIAFSPHGKVVACGGWDRESSGRGLIQLFDRDTGKLLREVRGHLSPVRGLAFSADGRLLFSRGHLQRGDLGGEIRRRETKHVRLWGLATGRERRGFSSFVDGTTVAVSPDGRALALHGKLELVEVATGDQRVELTGHKGHVYPPAFSPDGRTLASGGSDGTVRLWSLPSGKEIGRLEGHRGLVEKVVFAPDGRSVVSGGSDATVRIWDVRRFVLMRPPAVRLAAADLARTWGDLAGDAAVSYRAIGRLVSSPAQAVALLQGRLRPAVSADARLVARLIADLDSEQFEVRERASEGLAKLGELALPALDKALAARPGLEVVRRLEELRDRLEGEIPPSERLREVRAVEALEMVGGADARRLLTVLAKGAPEARLTREANEALGRLAKRPAP